MTGEFSENNTRLVCSVRQSSTRARRHGYKDTKPQTLHTCNCEWHSMLSVHTQLSIIHNAKKLFTFAWHGKAIYQVWLRSFYKRRHN